MPAVMSLGGIALAVLGLLIALLGLPDRMAGLSLGSDLVQAGASIFAGGLVVAALGQVLKALREVSERVEEAGFGISAPRSLSDGASDSPMPLPRAARNAAATAQHDDMADAPPSPGREPRSPRGQQPAAARPGRAAAEAQRPQPRAQARTAQQPEQNFEGQRQHEEFADDFPGQRQDEQPAPRWMRAQAETNNRQQAAGVIPVQSNRPARATPVAPSVQSPAPGAHDGEPRRRTAPPPQDENQQPEPTVVRSGIIGGMAYTLYSDRSIEAELPAGTVRFGSIEELQEHVKRAGVDEQDDYRGPNTAQH
jgi:hypothetical protein